MLAIAKPDKLGARDSANLDLVRGLAAIAVMVGHLRGMFFFDFSALAAPTLFTRVIYAITGLGHEAVMVFFVLSGYFVGGSVWAALPHWSWKRYLVNRLTRLYLVLIPALLLTAAADFAAYRNPAGPAFYDHPIPHFAAEPLSHHRSVGTFVGNALFLQMIYVPTFGSNSPLWSLANEFWYYLLFPAMMLGLLGNRNWQQRLSWLTATLLLLYWLPGGMRWGFVVWLLGASIHYLRTLSVHVTLRSGIVLLTSALFAATLALARVQRLPADWADLAVGASFALWLACLLKLGRKRSAISSIYRRLAKLAAQCSYSVYAVHLPMVLLIRTAVGTRLWDPTIANLSIWSFVALAVFGAGYLFSRLTEAHTDTVRNRVSQLLAAPRMSRTTVAVGADLAA